MIFSMNKITGLKKLIISFAIKYETKTSMMIRNHINEKFFFFLKSKLLNIIVPFLYF